MRELAEYAVNFLNAKQYIAQNVYDRAKLFHTDAAICAVAAIALKAKAPTILRESALNSYSYSDQKPEGIKVAKMFGCEQYTNIEKAIVANVSAIQELNANGFSLGYSFDELEKNSAGEIDYNSFYPVVIAASHMNPDINGKKALKAMILLDEIRGRLDESYDLSENKLDQALFGGIASTAVYGALMNASAEQIEHGIRLLLAHYTPWRAVKGGVYELADSSSCSSAFTTEMGILCMNRVLDGFRGPDVSTINPNNIKVRTSGDKFSIMGMHFRFGCYAAYSSGAIYSLVNVLLENPQIFENYDFEDITTIRVRTFTRAYDMLGKLPRSDYPTSRQAASYSIPYLLARMLSKKKHLKGNVKRTFQDFYNKLVLGPLDFTKKALVDEVTCQLMSKIDVIDGGTSYNKHYPEGLPSNLNIYFKDGTRFSSGMTKFPCGHANNKTVDSKIMLLNKFGIFGSLGLDNRSLIKYIVNLQNIDEMSNEELTRLYN